MSSRSDPPLHAIILVQVRQIAGQKPSDLSENPIGAAFLPLLHAAYDYGRITAAVHELQNLPPVSQNRLGQFAKKTLEC